MRDARLLTAETEMELMQRELAESKARCRRLETHVAAADALTATLQQEQVGHSDATVANRNATVWHGAAENGP